VSNLPIHSEPHEAADAGVPQCVLTTCRTLFAVHGALAPETTQLSDDQRAGTGLSITTRRKFSSLTSVASLPSSWEAPLAYRHLVHREPHGFEVPAAALLDEQELVVEHLAALLYGAGGEEPERLLSVAGSKGSCRPVSGCLRAAPVRTAGPRAGGTASA